MCVCVYYGFVFKLLLYNKENNDNMKGGNSLQFVKINDMTTRQINMKINLQLK